MAWEAGLICSDPMVIVIYKTLSGHLKRSNNVPLQKVSETGTLFAIKTNSSEIGTFIVKDIEERQRRKETDPNKRKVSDLALLRRGYRVNVGKIGSTEVDFVARKNEDIIYYQVTASMTEESTFEREMAPLKAIRDNYPKYIITLDRFTPGNYEGIQVVHAVDWLLEK